MSRQSAAKGLSIEEIHAQSSTTIPRKGSRLDLFLSEKPDIKFNKVFSKLCFNKSSCIYIIYTLHNNVLYVGSTKCIQVRLQKHRDNLRRNIHPSKWLQNVYNKYGKDNIYYAVIKILPNLDNVEKIEEEWIRYFDTYKNGYNSTYNTTRNLISEKVISKNIERQSKPVVVLDMNNNFVEELSSVANAARKYKTSSSNISRCCVGVFRHIKNHKFLYKENYDINIDYTVKDRDYSKSPEWIAKITAKLIGRKQSEVWRFKISQKQGKKIICKTDNLCFYSLSDAEKHYNISPSSITRAIKQKRYCKGLWFEFIEDIV